MTRLLRALLRRLRHRHRWVYILGVELTPGYRECLDCGRWERLT